MSASAAPGTLDPIAELPDTRRSVQDRGRSSRLSRRFLGRWRRRAADRDDPDPDEHGRDPGQLDGPRAVPGDDRGDDTRHGDQEEGRSKPYKGHTVKKPEPGQIREARYQDTKDKQPGAQAGEAVPHGFQLRPSRSEGRPGGPGSGIGPSFEELRRKLRYADYLGALQHLVRNDSTHWIPRPCKRER